MIRIREMTRGKVSQSFFVFSTVNISYSQVTWLQERSTSFDEISCGTVQYGGERMAMLIGQFQTPIMVLELDNMEKGWTQPAGLENAYGMRCFPEIIPQ